MNREEPYREQAERLKQRIQKINEHIDEKVEAADAMPPREHVHRAKKKKMKWKLKYPVIRLLVLFFILLPVIIFSIISYVDGKKIVRPEKTSGDSVETINLEDSNDEDNKLPEDGQIIDQEEEPNKVEENSPAPQSEEETPAEEIEASDEASSSPANPVSSEVAAEEQPVEKNSQPANSPKSQPQPKPVAKSTKIVYHTVQPKETLFRLSMKYYNSQAGINIIRKANRIQGDEIYVGQVLKIPLNN